MDLRVFDALFSTLYTDTLTIYRYMETESADGTTEISLQTTATQEDIQCRISFKQDDSSDNELNDRNPIGLRIKVFCAPHIIIHKGDLLVVQRLDNDGDITAEYKGIASMPTIYPTHQEVSIAIEGDA